MHENEALVRSLFEVFMRGDQDAAAAMFAEDAVFRYQGPGSIHGEWKGRSGIIGFWDAQARNSDGNLRPEMVDLVAGDRSVYLRVRFPRVDGSGSWERVVVYEIEGGMIVAAQVFEGDPDAAVDFFSRG